MSGVVVLQALNEEHRPCFSACVDLAVCTWARKVDIRLPGKRGSNSHGARPVHQKHRWTRTSSLSIKNSLSLHVGFCCLVDTTQAVTSVPAMPIRTTLQGAYSNLQGAYSNLQGAYSNLHHSGRSSLLICLSEYGSIGPYLEMVWADTDNPVLYIGRRGLIPIVTWADTDNSVLCIEM